MAEPTTRKPRVRRTEAAAPEVAVDLAEVTLTGSPEPATKPVQPAESAEPVQDDADSEAEAFTPPPAATAPLEPAPPATPATPSLVVLPLAVIDPRLVGAELVNVDGELFTDPDDLFDEIGPHATVVTVRHRMRVRTVPENAKTPVAQLFATARSTVPRSVAEQVKALVAAQGAATH
ncbi:hypothetical protein GCM10022221_67410 [Actinocorallia aurea]